MNGIDYLVDTNILIYILKGDNRIKYFSETDYLTISCISEMEILGKYLIPEEEKYIIIRLLEKCNILELNRNIKQLAIQIRQNTRTKLPDAIIAATAMYYDLPLVTADAGFEKITNLDLILIK